MIILWFVVKGMTEHMLTELEERIKLEEKTKHGGSLGIGRTPKNIAMAELPQAAVAT